MGTREEALVRAVTDAVMETLGRAEG
jgi:phenylpyruvate tautomerase PptA (4-oxalocrotonate tautomerase family)